MTLSRFLLFVLIVTIAQAQTPGPLKIGFKMINSPSERARHDEHRASYGEARTRRVA